MCVHKYTYFTQALRTTRHFLSFSVFLLNYYELEDYHHGGICIALLSVLE